MLHVSYFSFGIFSGTQTRLSSSLEKSSILKLSLVQFMVSHHAFASLVSTVADYDELVCCGSSFQQSNASIERFFVAQ